MSETIQRSNHFDGARFFNPAPHDAARGLTEVAKWRRESKPSLWPRFVPNPAYPLPRTTVAPGNVAVTFIGHATFLIRLPGALILTDPQFSPRCSPVQWAGPKRVREPGVALRDLPRPDLILLSHNHYDHMDMPSLRSLQRRFKAPVVTLLGNARHLRRLGIHAKELDWWHTTESGALRITATPARHFSARTPFDRNRSLWGGFMIQHGDHRILFAGDSGMGPHWAEIRARLGAPALALLPIGAYEPRWFMAPVHMNPDEAVQAHLDLQSRRSIGMHFGTFQLTDEAIDAPLVALSAARLRHQVAPDTFSTLGFGETTLFPLSHDP